MELRIRHIEIDITIQRITSAPKNTVFSLQILFKSDNLKWGKGELCNKLT